LLISINLATEKETEAALRAQNSKHPQVSPEFLNALTEEEKLQLEFKNSPRDKRKFPESAQLIMEENKDLAEQEIRKNQKKQEEERVVKKFLFKSGDDLR
jgi:serine phosphatase RsbU (regulator of sigma subunit)